MATETSKSSVLSLILGAAVVALGAVAVFLFVGKTGLPSAEQNTLAQAQGPLPPPARLPTSAQSAEQMAPARLATPEQPAQQIVPEAQPQPAPQEQQQAPNQQRRAPAESAVTRLPPAAAPNQHRPVASQPQGRPASQPQGSCDDPEYAAKYC